MMGLMFYDIKYDITIIRSLIRYWLTYIAFYRRRVRLRLCVVIQTNLFSP